MTDPSAKKSDLPVRVASAVVMAAVAGTALWLGGAVWVAFVGIVAAGVLWEWRGLSWELAKGPITKVGWTIAGMLYIGIAASVLMVLRSDQFTLWVVATIVLAVVGTDVGAYFVGRTVGGPKIAPSISPSKTWAGLIGGAFGASAVLFLVSTLHLAQQTEATSEAGFYTHPLLDWKTGPWIGGVVAIVAQAGDFFESWMKRRAGVKDSGKLLPGHGGLFDRVDGLLAVLFVIGLIILAVVLPSSLVSLQST